MLADWPEANATSGCLHLKISQPRPGSIRRNDVYARSIANSRKGYKSTQAKIRCYAMHARCADKRFIAGWNDSVACHGHGQHLTAAQPSIPISLTLFSNFS